MEILMRSIRENGNAMAMLEIPTLILSAKQKTALAPLQCADQSCGSASNWTSLEDWFLDICPNSPAVGFQSLRLCGRRCIRSFLVEQACPPAHSDESGDDQFNRNCVCRFEGPIMNQMKCLPTNQCASSTAQTGTILKSFDRSNCVYDPSADEGFNPQPTADAIIYSSPNFSKVTSTHWKSWKTAKSSVGSSAPIFEMKLAMRQRERLREEWSALTGTERLAMRKEWEGASRSTLISEWYT
ncbi:hypothetical protein NA57DRAFT_53130 [Rhizodiscina lignyota]|uniref:Uncharacterized protein n=1 Tax=Rhizodiscina lignyota TaxID=1504668 RepID=A0A9P4MAU0_9PEZI|nr:hypothetical protein NA57DRAFT_53130 [Rhizodiscina lignyota]